MGNNKSLEIMSSESLEQYVYLSYLTRSEIIKLMKKFYKLGPQKIDQDFYYRFPRNEVEQLFLNIKYNPFCDRIFHVFSSKKDDCFSFEDILDFYSVLSENCPDNIKAKWIFKIFDFNGDEEIGKDDIIKVIDKLTSSYFIKISEKKYIADMLLKQMDIQNVGSISALEFEHAVGKMTEFAHMFSSTV